MESQNQIEFIIGDYINMRKKFLSVIAVSALLLGTNLTSCAEPTTNIVVEKHFGVSITSNGNGKITTSAQVAKVGEPVTLNAIPVEGFMLGSLKINGAESVSSVKDNSLTTNMVENGILVEATFVETTYKVTIGTLEHGTISSDTAEGITGTKVNFTITPEFGYKLSEFKVNTQDQLSNVIDGHFETTIEKSDLVIAAKFTALESSDLINNLYKTVEKAMELEGQATKATKLNEKGEAISTFQKFKDDTQGTFSITTKKGYGTQCEKIVESEGKLYLIKYTLQNGKPTNPSYSEFKSNNIAKEDALNKAEQGKGFIKNNLLTSIKANGAWKVVDEELKSEKNVLTLTRHYIEYGFYIENEFVITFDDASRISSFSFKKLTAYNLKNDDNSQPMFDENGKPIFEGGKPEYSSTIAGSVKYEFGEIGTEPAESASLKLSELIANDFKVKLTDKSTGLEAHPTKLTVGHEYTIGFIDVLPKTANINDYSINYLEYNNITSENLKFNRDYNGKIYSITPLKDIEFGSIEIKAGTKTLFVSLGATTPELTTITVTPSSNTVDIQNVVSLSVSTNDIGCNSNVAFAFEGDNLGCTITKVSNNEYQLNAGNQVGVVKFRAISQQDSKIQSELITIEIAKPLTFEEKLSRTFVNNTLNSRYGYTCSSNLKINTSDGVNGTISNGSETVELTITQNEGMITGELKAPLKISLLDEQGATIEAYFNSFSASDWVVINENFEYGFGLEIDNLYKVVDGQNEPLYIRISLVPQN